MADASSGAAVDVVLSGGLPVPAQAVGGYVTYPAALRGGAALLQRALPDGTEDFIYFTARPASPELDYTVSLGPGIAGLRLVGGVLEFVDASGTPRLHVSPPYIIGADGSSTDGALAVAGCAVDTDPSPPWGRPVTAPGDTSCTVQVTWPDAAVTYPAILDPKWSTTGSMATARFEHTLTVLSTGRALAAGGRNSTSSTTGLASAELYDQTSGTWSATGSLAHGRRLHTATQLATSSNPTTGGKILLAGGISGTTSLNTAELYSPSAGTWSAAGTMNAVRHGHTATLLPDGRVLAAGGLNGTTTLQSASLYNPASGSGSWVATTGPIPPPGLKNHTATLIQTSNAQLNNRVLLVGGNNGTSTVAAVYLFDPTQNAFSTLASISTPREQHMAATLQNTNGKIVIAGGKNGSTVLSSAIVFDPGTSNGSWSSAGTMTSPRLGATMTLLPNTIVDQGQVLVAGGSSTGSDTLSSAELFSNTSTWTGTASMPGPMKSQPAVLLSGNMILLAGGVNGSTVLASAFLYDASFGLSCTSNSQCASGFCTNGVCCESACNSGTCGACNVAGHLGTCSPRISGTLCRASTGACDPVETCDGTSLSCPSDSLASAGTVCRGSTGPCDPAETCSGTSASCPSDSLASAGTVCRAAAGGCDVAETCSGTSASCPADGVAAAGTVCRAVAGTCDVAETCNGTSTACPTDTFLPPTTVCRASTGQCDAAENCTGSSASCPADGSVANGTACNDGNACTQADTCQAGTCTGSNPVTCTAQDQCHGAGTCDPSTGVCSNPALANGTACNDGNACTQTDSCQAGTCTGSTPVTCTAQDQCHGAGTCNPSTGVCSNPALADGTGCNDGNACTQSDTCHTGACVGSNPVVCAGSGDSCRGAGTCDPATGSCSAAPAPDGQACEDGNRCTVGDSCSKGTCIPGPADACTAPTDNKYARVIDLGATMFASYAQRINNSGQVVGSEKTNGSYFEGMGDPSRAYIWSEAAGKVYLPAPMDYADDINDDGIIAGRAGLTYARFDPAHDAAPVVLSGAADRQARLNASGVVTGGAYFNGLLSMFRWSGGTPEPLPALPGAPGWTFGLGIDDDGTVAGYQYNEQLATYAIRYTDTRGTEALTDLLPADTQWSLVHASFVRNGVFIGTGINPAGLHHGYRLNTTPAGDFQSITDLGLPDSYDPLAPNIIEPAQMSVYGEIVGTIIDAGDNTWPENAFLYSDALGRPVLLDSLIDPQAGWHIQAAFGINDNHQVVGYGVHDGQTRAFELALPDMSPCPPPPTCRGPGVRDLLTGQCSYPPADEGAQCSDGNLCMTGQTCHLGTCSGTPIVCAAPGPCQTAGTCNPATGCSYAASTDPVCAVVPRLDGVATIDGTKYAVFSYNNPGADASIPRGAQNQLMVNGTAVTTTTPPPAWFLAGDHAGAFSPKLDGASLSWTLNGITVTADASSPDLPVTTQAQGEGVLIADQFVPLVPDLTQYRAIPNEPASAPDPAKGNEFHGTLPGQLTVSPTGAAIYTIPLSVPPGIAGIAPVLSLVYNSQGGSGLAGQGFELAGLSAITRCPRSKAADGYSSPISEVGAEPGTDAVCIDGQRLYERSSGAGRQYFETAVKDFSTISYDSRTNAFTVVTKSGQTRTYGTGPLTQVNVPGPTETVTSVWLLDKVSDQWGNYYTVQYNHGTADFLSEGILPSKIDYTGHEGTTRTPIFHSVTFGYEPINHVHYTRLFNTAIPRSSRLKTIDNGIGTYALTYLDDEPMLQSRLQDVKYCAYDGTTCRESLHFFWEGGQAVNNGWVPTSAYTLPASIVSTYDSSFFGGTHKSFSGTQFVDLDGDGRVDFVRMKAGQPNAAWRNTGSGWESRPDWIMQGFDTSLFNRLTDSDGKPAGGYFADFDGDGILDFISGPKSPCDCPSLVPEIDGYCLGTRFCESAPISVWLNRIRSGQGWQQSATLSQTPSDWGDVDLTNIDSIQDMNGDGRADIVRRGDGNALKVLVNLGPNQGWAEDAGYEGSLPQSAKYYSLMDLDGDGSPDLISNNQQPNSSVFYNAGTSASYPKLRGPASNPIDALNAAYLLPQGSDFLGDIDGDGRRDLLSAEFLFWRADPTKSWNHSLSSAVTLGNGLGYSSGPSDPLVATYAQAFIEIVNDAVSNIPDPTFTYDNGTAADIPVNLDLVDLNADGLADLVLSPQGTGFGGQGYVHFNNGRGWLPTPGEGQSGSAPVPVLPYVDGPATFVDLNGDGAIDIASDSGAWLNTFVPPEITGFPNGLAATTIASYETITTQQAHDDGTYADNLGVTDGTRYYTPPVRVVSNLWTDDGIGGTPGCRSGGCTGNHTTYQYDSMRASTTGHGPQGFATVKTTDPSNITTLTTFSQHYPYTGRPVDVLKGLIPSAGSYFTFDTYGLTKTDTTYCDDPSGSHCTPPTGGEFPPETSLFIYPQTVTDTAQIRTSFPDGKAPFGLAGYVTTTTTNQYDDFGNAIRIAVNTRRSSGGQYETVITNTYGDPDSLERELGKVTRTEVNTTRINPAPVLETGDGAPTRHVTEYEYAYFFDAYALWRTKVEPGSAQAGAELHTAVDYDEFGNVVTTTVCASDFDNCAAGAPGPADMPYRTSRVSYDPADFNAPSGPNLVPAPLSYPKGRHPVMTTDPMGHHEFMAFDATTGVLRQKTAINGVHSCMFYNALADLYLSGERCGTDGAMGTYVHRYFYDTGDIPHARVVTITEPPAGTPSWEYTDGYGRTVATRVRSFDGDHSETRTEYDRLGRVHRISKPFFSSEGPTDFTTTEYDDLGRVRTTQTLLGNIDGTNTSSPVTTSSTTLTMSYFGDMIRTDQTALVGRYREETKNVLGKVSSMKDVNGKVISYAYDAEGNLTSTRDPNGNQIFIQYDVRGRKKVTRDPDLGQWAYTYDGFGDLQTQTDGNGATTSMFYDALGRMTSKTDATGTSQWVYDTAQVTGSNPIAGQGKLAYSIGPTDDRLAGSCTRDDIAQNVGKRPVESFQYDQFGQVTDALDCADGEVFQTLYQYDSFGRQLLIQYPFQGDSLRVENHYTQSGYLQYVENVADQGVYWQALEMNAAGQVTREQTRNGVETVVQRNPLTGWTLGSTSTSHAQEDQIIQEWRYGFDEMGNLKKRIRQDHVNARDTTELFDYDALDRLTGSTLEAGTTTSEGYDYDALGNFTTKAGAGYTYGTCGAGPHAPCTVGGSAPFVYDGNGNMLQGSGRAVTYSGSNKPLTIVGNGTNVGLIYGGDGTRAVQLVGSDPRSSPRTVYVGMGPTGASLLERTRYGDPQLGPVKTEYTQFIYAGNAHGGAPFAVRTIVDDNGIIIGPDGVGEMKYIHRDHLGSVTAMSDREGHVVDSATGGRNPGVFGYDAWGAQRTPEGTALDPASVDPPPGNRGFTGQETIAAVGLVNMNGRVYDPVIGRFLSPDSNIQFVADLQSYNRYSYVLNNPLRYTDPTGHFSFRLGVAGDLVLGAVAIGVCTLGGPACVAAIAAVQAINTVSAVSNGAPWDEAVVFSAIEFGIDYASVGVGNAAANALGLGQSAWGSITSGAISGAMTATVNTLASGGDLGSLGENVLMGAAMGAANAAYGVALRIAMSPVTQKEADDQIDFSAKGNRLQNSPPDHPDGQKFPIFQKVDHSWWQFWWWFSDEYRLTDQAVGFFQPKVDAAIARAKVSGTVDLAGLRFTEGEIVASDGSHSAGRWLGGNQIKISTGLTQAAFSSQFLTVAHETFHVAQAYVLGGGNVSIGEHLVHANYGRPLFDASGFIARESWNDMLPGAFAPYEDEADRYAISLYQSFY